MENKISPTLMIKGVGFSRAWAIAVYATRKYGAIIQGEPDRPNTSPFLTKDVCAVIEYGPEAINEIFSRQLHGLYPQQHGYEIYEKQFDLGSEEYHQSNDPIDGHDYTYPRRLRRYECVCDKYNNTLCNGMIGGRVCQYYNSGNFTDGYCFIDQLKYIADNLEPFNRRLQAITWDVQQDLKSDLTVPCLQRIQVRNRGNGTYEIFFSWRSRDLFKAYQWNLLGLINAINQLIQDTRKEQGLPPLKLVRVVDMVTCLHIYESEWDMAAKVPVSAEEIKMHLYI